MNKKHHVSTPKMQSFESREISLISKTMKKARFTEAQVVQAPQKHESGLATGVKPRNGHRTRSLLQLD